MLMKSQVSTIRAREMNSILKSGDDSFKTAG